MITEHQRIWDVEKDPEANARLRAFTSISLFRRIFALLRPFRLGTLKKWHLPLLGDLLNFVNGEPNVFPEGHPRRQPLWNGEPPLGSLEEAPYLVSYRLDREAPAVLLVPGGAYNSVVMGEEGRDIAERLNEKGYHAFVVRYRVSPNRYPASHLDVIRAMQLLRANAGAWKILPDQIILAGFSAGGHLAASMPGLYQELRRQTGELSELSALPDGMILGYPAIDMNDTFFGISIGVFLLGDKAESALKNKISAQNLVDEAYPPTYLFSVDGDPLVNVERNALQMKKALERNNVPVKTHIFHGNEHGSGAVGLEEWLDEALEFCNRERKTARQ